MERPGDSQILDESGAYSVQIDDMNFQIFNRDGASLGLVWNVTGSNPTEWRCVPTSNIGRPIHGGIFATFLDAATRCIEAASL